MDKKHLEKTRTWLDLAEKILPDGLGRIGNPTSAQANGNGFEANYLVIAPNYEGSTYVHVAVFRNFRVRKELAADISVHSDLFGNPTIANWIINDKLNQSDKPIGSWWSNDEHRSHYHLTLSDLPQRARTELFKALETQDQLIDLLQEARDRLDKAFDVKYAD